MDFFLIFNFCSYSEDSGIPGIPAFRHSMFSKLPRFCVKCGVWLTTGLNLNCKHAIEYLKR